MAKLHRSSIFIVVFMLLVAARPAGAQGTDTARVLLDWTPIGSHAWVYLAEAKGFFKEAGVTVQLSEAKGGTTTAQQVAADQADIGFAQLAAMATAKGAGMPLISVAGYAQGGDLGVLIPKSTGIKTMKELEGKRLGYPASGTAGPLLQPFLKASGVDPAKITAVNVDANSLINVYVNRNVDAILTSIGFFAYIADEKIPSNVIMLSSAGIVLPGYGLFVNQKLLPEKSKMLAKLVPAANRTWNYIFDNHVDEAIDAMMSARSGDRLDRKLLHGQLVAYMSEFATPAMTGKPMGWQTDENWHAAIKTLETADMVKPNSKPSDYYTNQFIK